ncbi:MAG: hypothetical protein HYV03_07270, partial [Deltaproteobacteria bacterium]|nr:hypothetical protein [Deltaproteobacteria bacterium]
MELRSMPKETAAEVLQFLAEHEEFRAVAEAVGEDLAVDEVRVLLKELAFELRRQAATSPRAGVDVSNSSYLSNPATQIIPCLSPMEERTLLAAFG